MSADKPPVVGREYYLPLIRHRDVLRVRLVGLTDDLLLLKHRVGYSTFMDVCSRKDYESRLVPIHRWWEFWKRSPRRTHE